MTTLPKLWKYYLAAALLPLVLNVLATTGWVIYEYRWGDFQGLTKAQLEGENLYVTFIAMAFGNGLVLAALQTTLFLNGVPAIRNKAVLSLLCWSLLPLCWLLYLVTYVDIDETIILWLVLTMTVPYVMANPWSFFRYRRALRGAEVVTDSTANVAGTATNDSTEVASGYSSPSAPEVPGAPEH